MQCTCKNNRVFKSPTRHFSIALKNDLLVLNSPHVHMYNLYQIMILLVKYCDIYTSLRKYNKTETYHVFFLCSPCPLSSLLKYTPLSFGPRVKLKLTFMPWNTWISRWIYYNRICIVLLPIVPSLFDNSDPTIVFITTSMLKWNIEFTSQTVKGKREEGIAVDFELMFSMLSIIGI